MPSIGSTRMVSRRGGLSAEEIVARAEAYFRACDGMPVSLAAISRKIGLSERSLRNAFYGVRGMSPTQFVRQQRLLSVRRALSDRQVARPTVTGVAVSHGFYELGRFAAAYRKAFGEAPSETLRRHTTSQTGASVYTRG
jgi:AraC family ethanolamine operon transcriptional activator